MAMEVADVAFLVGRVLFGGFFVMNASNHFMKHDMLAAYAESKDVPWASAMVYATGLLLLGGGLSVLLGAYPWIGVALLAVFFVGVTPVMHDFWDMDGEQRQQEMVNFMKNTALLGAALMLLGVETWPYALAAGL